ncbi:DUF378 domain-containing protein [Chlamydiifrater phoenicopteri]|uniref:DUF378 domain-containing protein n=1 Tax=Chlamydiifrater phoenicopteri TaxID=2681469 RepID=UPI001BD08FFD|nr:DUF378 domain-containing protein [Chlamydiifrater phoenicopteri]
MLGKLFRGLSSLIVILSALNMGLIGITNNKYDLMTTLFGASGSLRLAYTIVGVAGAISLFYMGRSCCKSHHKGSCSAHHDKKD